MPANPSSPEQQPHASNIEWKPPINTGLSNSDVYLSEQIENFAASPTAAHKPGVYVLEFSLPIISKDSKRDQMKQLWLESKETLPRYIDELIDAEKLLYVGYSENVYTRIQDHINKHQTTTLADVFPIHSIFDIYFYNSKEKAKTKEKYHTDDLNNAYPTAYVHSR